MNGPMERFYFHDAENKTVYSVPKEPHSDESPDGSIFLSVEWTITSANNYRIHPPHHWKYPTSKQQSERYPAKDAKDALGYFRIFKYPHFPEIDKAEYERLHEQYDTQANKNTPPKD